MNIEELIKPYLQRKVRFKIGAKVIREGKLLLLNNKDYYVVFNLRTSQGIKTFEIPVPFNIHKFSSHIVFDYSLESIYRHDLSLEVLIKTGFQSKSKLYNKQLILEFK